MIQSIVGFLIGALCLFILSYILPREKVKKHNAALSQEEQEEKARIVALQQELALLSLQVEKERVAYNSEITLLQEKKANLVSEIAVSKQSAEDQAKSYYNQKIAEANASIQSATDLMTISFEREAQSKQKAHLDALAALSQEFQIMREEATQDLASAISAAKVELDALTSTLGFLKDCVNAATAEKKRAQLELTAKDFYRVVISKIDSEEIAKIRSIEPYLRNAEVLNKVIWTYYYRTPANDMINRVVGSDAKTGIYKITNINNGMVYVGQANNFKDRFIQHIKRGIGAENGGHVKLYPAMYEEGVENFTFEILEECMPEELNDKEKYWIDFYNGVEYGYNMKL